jgi:hypothetical protein
MWYDKCQPLQHEQPKHLPRWNASLHGAMQEVGHALTSQYEVPTELPPQMLTLLKRLTEQGKEK